MREEGGGKEEGRRKERICNAICGGKRLVKAGGRGVGWMEVRDGEREWEERWDGGEEGRKAGKGYSGKGHT